MKLQNFSGGLNTRLRPQYLQLNEAVIYENLDNEKGSLAAVPSEVASNINTSRFAVFYNAVQQWVSSDIRRDYVEFQKILYFTDGTKVPKKFDGTNTFNLGITAPITSAVTTTVSVAPAPKQVNITAGLIGNLPNEEIFYRLVNFQSPYYSAPFDFTYNPENSQGAPSIISDESTFGRLSLKLFDVVNVGTIFSTSITIEPLDGADGDLYRLFNGKWRFVHRIVATGPNQTDSVLDISANVELEEIKIAPVAGNMQYVYTFVNSADGTESAPSPVSDILENALGDITILMDVSTDLQVDRKRIYRIGGFITTFSLVIEVDNSVTEFIDTIKDTDVIGTILTAQTNNAAPAGLTSLTEAYAMLFGADDTKLRFTPIGKPNAWPALNFLQFDAPITGIMPVTNGIIVSTLFRSRIVLGTSPLRLSQQSLDGSQGCVDPSSIQRLKGTAIWVSSDGICISNGNNINVISRPKLGKITIRPVDSVVHDDVYYVIESTGDILAMDYRYGEVFKNFNLGVDSLVNGADILYGHKGGELQRLFADSTNKSFTYLSPKFIEGRLTEEKTYRIVYIFSIGDIIINILINDISVRTKALSGTKMHEIKVPQDKQRGNFIQFRITGTGEVLELEYEVGRGHGHGG